MRYKSKARSDEAPHVLALADRAWQDMMHHKEQQNIVFTGETFSGKSYNFESTLEHLLFIGKVSMLTFRDVLIGYLDSIRLVALKYPCNFLC